MSVTREELAAFADGELDADRERQVAAAVAANPALAEQIRAHRALKARLGAHFAPILQAPVPERLTAALRSEPQVVSFAAARARKDRARVLPRWSWVAGPALVASLVLAVVMPRGGADYAERPLSTALDRQLAGSQDAAGPMRILLSFRDDSGAYCRAFAGEAHSGIACRDDAGWRLVFEGAGVPVQRGDYRMAGNPAAEVLERAQALAAGPALDAAQEQAARERGWR
ncbi:MAG TPA: anti-sigma factor [Croceibacterium sp.]|nr:anti-sigma factor [Croceibacterium sp.]